MRVTSSGLLFKDRHLGATLGSQTGSRLSPGATVPRWFCHSWAGGAAQGTPEIQDCPSQQETQDVRRPWGKGVMMLQPKKKMYYPCSVVSAS